MPSAITISQLSYSAPDGRQLFNKIDLSFNAGRTGIVGRNGGGKSTLLGLTMGTLVASSGTVAVHGRVAMLRQDVGASDGETIMDLFDVSAPWQAMQKAIAGDAALEDFDTIDWTLDARIEEALSSFGLVATAETVLAELSGGQRVRAALAALEFSQPHIILLDEPTNNLDREGRAAVLHLLKRWRGTAIVVSHDRELLEEMDTIVELTGLGARSYGGNYSFYRERKALELAAAQHDLDVAQQQKDDAARSAQQAKERQDRRNASGRKSAARGGAPKILLGGLKRQAEGTSGSIDKLGQRQAAAADDAIRAAREQIEVLAPFAVKLAPTGLHAGKVVLRASGLTGGYVPDAPVIRGFDFEIIGPERVALVGRNGAGKSTALKLLTGALPSTAGRVEAFGPVAMLDQHVGLLNRDETVLENFQRLNADNTINDGRAVLAAFKFRNDAAQQTVGTLSGGELLRAGLACVLGGVTTPMLLVLDEPTNHLDIEAIEVVEAGLRAFDGALLVVSHDTAFLENIGVTRWVEIGG
ncbi:ABC-F family ATP-binding cassette domain-containing protein [Devosia sp. WQ 349]|uniref:ABC-F family ATP-binding cassette domain-containing protein n=1 Tax=Devosia sp. WQ 349K1 TaxID=2800329 RepID=UPI001905DB3E|nr:ABC-F family ATP-binding cassette domain-containing protein [Devosia sp. WQ 349K1]MBK1793817.1 ABC-F family ATP-binding cassette domain-containing protein [Devosia sp. WQ 349K1]